jgi:hypothetical protein
VSEGLETLVVEPAILEVAGRTFQVHPLTIGQLPRFTKAVRPLMAEIGKDDFDVVALIAEHGERLTEAIAIVTHASVDEIGALPAEAIVPLATAVVEANLDFFAQRLLPAFVQAADRLTLELGRMPFNASSAPGTGSPTS